MTMHTDPTVPPVADAPKKKNWFARHKVLTTIGAIVLIIVIVNATRGGDPAPSADATTSASSAPAVSDAPAEDKAEDKAGTATEEKPAEKPSTPGFGVPVTESDLEFTAIGIASAGAQVGDQYLNAQAQGTFQRLTIRVKNVGTSGQTFTTSSLTIIDQDGREFDADSLATAYGNSDSGMWLSQINPGNAVEGDVIFDLPAGAVPTTLVAKGGFFGSGVEISLAK